MTFQTGVRCFFCEPSGRERLFLRRFVFSSQAKCPSKPGYHNARVSIGEDAESNQPREHRHDDERWPVKCERCDYVFTQDDQWQVFSETIYIRGDTGAETVRSDNIPGMMFDAFWMPRKGPDGKSLWVILPNGKDWAIDERATNCDLPKDNIHRCWIRTGEPPNITVGKKGPTCNAGAGSIRAGDYHGHLEDGKFRP